MRKNILKIFSLLALLSFSTASCSVNMAASGKMKPNLDKVKVGDTRDFVIQQLGKPAVVKEDESSPSDVFYFKSGMPLFRYCRAFIYAALDVGTFGLWELLGMPLEGFIQNKDSVTVTYDKDKTVSDIETINEY